MTHLFKEGYSYKLGFEATPQTHHICLVHQHAGKLSMLVTQLCACKWAVMSRVQIIRNPVKHGAETEKHGAGTNLKLKYMHGA